MNTFRLRYNKTLRLYELLYKPDSKSKWEVAEQCKEKSPLYTYARINDYKVREIK